MDDTTKTNLPEANHRAIWVELATQDEMFLGNRSAREMLGILARASHFYDDLIDAPANVSAQTIHLAMWDIMVALPLNEFYCAHLKALAPVIASGILNWRAANDMEKTGRREELVISHALRYSIADVALLVMAILGGPDHAAKYARQAKLSFHEDTFEHYLSEHEKS